MKKNSLLLGKKSWREVWKPGGLCPMGADPWTHPAGALLHLSAVSDERAMNLWKINWQQIMKGSSVCSNLFLVFGGQFSNFSNLGGRGWEWRSGLLTKCISILYRYNFEPNARLSLGRKILTCLSITPLVWTHLFYIILFSHLLSRFQALKEFTVSKWRVSG